MEFVADMIKMCKNKCLLQKLRLLQSETFAVSRRAKRAFVSLLPARLGLKNSTSTEAKLATTLKLLQQ